MSLALAMVIPQEMASLLDAMLSLNAPLFRHMAMLWARSFRRVLLIGISPELPICTSRNAVAGLKDEVMIRAPECTADVAHRRCLRLIETVPLLIDSVVRFALMLLTWLTMKWQAPVATLLAVAIAVLTMPWLCVSPMLVFAVLTVPLPNAVPMSVLVLAVPNVVCVARVELVLKQHSAFGPKLNDPDRLLTAVDDSAVIEDGRLLSGLVDALGAGVAVAEVSICMPMMELGTCWVLVTMQAWIAALFLLIVATALLRLIEVIVVLLDMHVTSLAMGMRLLVLIPVELLSMPILEVFTPVRLTLVPMLMLHAPLLNMIRPYLPRWNRCDFDIRSIDVAVLTWWALLMVSVMLVLLFSAIALLGPLWQTPPLWKARLSMSPVPSIWPLPMQKAPFLTATPPRMALAADMAGPAGLIRTVLDLSWWNAPLWTAMLWAGLDLH